MKIGIAITTYNRPEVCLETYSILNKYRPENSMLVVVDDGGNSPVLNNFSNVFRFHKNMGVGYAKNKCLELLLKSDCTHFFLFDDDCRPRITNWWQDYIESTLEHACWTFDRRIVSELKGFYRSFEKPNGCMLYFTRKCVETIGGWDLDFKGYGYEHVNVSDRAFNAGLTPLRYVDAWHSEHPFELADCDSSFSWNDRYKIPANFQLYQQKFYSKEYKPFK